MKEKVHLKRNLQVAGYSNNSARVIVSEQKKFRFQNKNPENQCAHSQATIVRSGEQCDQAGRNVVIEEFMPVKDHLNSGNSVAFDQNYEINPHNSCLT